jgi:hypothetical protein
MADIFNYIFSKSWARAQLKPDLLNEFFKFENARPKVWGPTHL